jgi:acyl-CoA dehydrogenase
MEFSYTDTQRDLQERARAVAHEFGDDYWRKLEADSGPYGTLFPEAYWRRVVESGLAGVTISKEYGGMGLGLLDLCVAAETLAVEGTGSGGGGIFVVGPVFGGYLLERSGTPEQKERYLPGIVEGELWAGAFTEEDAGSNITTIETRAERDGDHYVVRGKKRYIGAAQTADHVVIYCRTGARDEAKRTQGVSLLVADLPDDALQAEALPKMGMRWIDTNRVTFDGLRVPAGNRIGEEGRAWRALYDVLNPERILIAAATVGTGLLCIQRAVDYAGERRVWGDVPIGAHQGVQFPLAQIKARLEGARQLVYRAAWLFDQGDPRCPVVTAQAKYLAVHAALDAADQAIQTLGGNGYLVDHDVERYWRDLRLNRIAPVTDEMTLAFLGQHDLGLPRSY